MSTASAVRRLGALAGVLLTGCGVSRSGEPAPAHVEAQLPTHLGELWSLCPTPDDPRRFYHEEVGKARRATRALIRAVRERPADVVTFESTDAHSGDVYREKMTVRELAEEHLETPGVKGVPCERALMQELQDAVDDKADPTPLPPNEVVFLYDDVVKALRLTEDRGVLRSPSGCEVDDILLDAHEVKVELEDPIADHAVITDPDQRVGVSVFKASSPCRREMENRLAHLAASKSN